MHLAGVWRHCGNAPEPLQEWDSRWAQPRAGAHQEHLGSFFELHATVFLTQIFRDFEISHRGSLPKPGCPLRESVMCVKATKRVGSHWYALGGGLGQIESSHSFMRFGSICFLASVKRFSKSRSWCQLLTSCCDLTQDT